MVGKTAGSCVGDDGSGRVMPVDTQLVKYFGLHIKVDCRIKQDKPWFPLDEAPKRLYKKRTQIPFSYLEIYCVTGVIINDARENT